jgi:hypothetical protein
MTDLGRDGMTVMPELLEPRRGAPIKVKWESSGGRWRRGRITIDGALWAFVEWSEKRPAWCIEDAAGQCLAHANSLCGEAASRKRALELASAMIRDGRLPSPKTRWRVGKRSSANVRSDARSGGNVHPSSEGGRNGSTQKKNIVD